MKTFFPSGDNDLALAYNARGKKDLIIEHDEVVAGGIKLYLRFQLFEGEWWGDTRIGVPYFRLILIKNPDLAVIRQVIRRVILSVEVIANVTSLEFDYDPITRKLSFTFEAVAADGRSIQGGSGKAFIIEGVETQFMDGLED